MSQDPLYDKSRKPALATSRERTTRRILQLQMNDVQPESLEYVFAPAQLNPNETEVPFTLKYSKWECALCQQKNKEELVWHPNNCHIFHRQCLNRLC